jgi:acyl-CoA reductase-like NAD-dependent aldehyde dehydrogenase
MENPADKNYDLYINGEWKPASDGETFDTTCPGNGEYLSTCAEATKEDVDEAVKAAQAAFETWKLVEPIERQEILMKIADIIDENAEKLALVESLDNGKALRETQAIDVPFSSDHFRYFAGAVRTEEGSAAKLDNNTLSLIFREPIGVVGQIVPWNFPLLMGAWKLAPVLAAGCCTVFKPSSSTPLSILEFAKMTEKVLPKGVFNVITGKGSKSGQYLLDHPGLRKLAFTGSTEVGCSVADAASKKLIPATLELGGKSANIYFEDCKWDMAMDGLQLGILFNQGQVCCAGSRVFIQESIYDKFIKEAVDQFKKLEVGMPWDPNAQMGAQINERQVEKILKCIEDGKKEGATVAVGGNRLTEGEFAKGCYVEPTLLTDVTNDMTVAREEIFGPVAVAMPFDTEEDVIKMANDNDYGLGGAVWTRDINRAFRVCNGIETGRMWINTYNSIPAGAPFGGYKISGIGRETHKVILDHYTQMKNIMINLSEAPSGFYPKK